MFGVLSYEMGDKLKRMLWDLLCWMFPQIHLKLKERLDLIDKLQAQAPKAGPLKKCPHCGSSEVDYSNGWGFGVRELDSVNPDGRQPEIVCNGCGCGFSAGWFGRGISDAKAMEITVKAWNRRPPKEKP
jgi:hypothetical protein